MINFAWDQIATRPPVVLVSDEEGEFGFIQYKKDRYLFKITEEKWLDDSELLEILNYMLSMKNNEKPINKP